MATETVRALRKLSTVYAGHARVAARCSLQEQEELGVLTGRSLTFVGEKDEVRTHSQRSNNGSSVNFSSNIARGGWRPWSRTLVDFAAVRTHSRAVDGFQA